MTRTKRFMAALFLILGLVSTPVPTQAQGAKGLVQGDQGLLTDGQRLRICGMWESNDFEGFEQIMSEAGVTISQVYYEIKCNIKLEKKIDIMRIMIRQPLEYGTEQYRFFKLIKQEDRLYGDPRGSYLLSCALTQIVIQNLNLLHFIRESIDRDIASMKTTSNEKLKEALKISIRVLRGRRDQYLAHLEKYPVTRADCPEWRKRKS